jgi:hypothetical protein
MNRRKFIQSASLGIGSTCLPIEASISTKQKELEYDKVCDEADKVSAWYYKKFEKVKDDMVQDLKALGKADEEILKEFLTDAYWYGYVNAKLHPGKNFGEFE